MRKAYSIMWCAKMIIEGRTSTLNFWSVPLATTLQTPNFILIQFPQLPHGHTKVGSSVSRNQIIEDCFNRFFSFLYPFSLYYLEKLYLMEKTKSTEQSATINIIIINPTVHERIRPSSWLPTVFVFILSWMERQLIRN